jgi:hypothetical protein
LNRFNNHTNYEGFLKDNNSKLQLAENIEFLQIGSFIREKARVRIPVSTLIARCLRTSTKLKAVQVYTVDVDFTQPQGKIQADLVDGINTGIANAQGKLRMVSMFYGCREEQWLWKAENSEPLELSRKWRVRQPGGL